MDGGNVDTWHNHMYENYMLVVEKLFNVLSIFNRFNLNTCCNYNVILEKIKHN